MASVAGKRKKLSAIVIDEIRRMIESGELKEGDRLPNQNRFAEELGVSRPSLREALSQLTNAGVVEQKPRAGTILKVANTDLWFGLPFAPVLSDRPATLELIEARKEIEPMATRLAVARLEPSDLRKIGASLEKMEEFFTAGARREYLKEDLTFHYLIAKAGRNRYVLQMLINLKLLMEEFMRESFDEIEGLLGSSLTHHRAIYAAIAERNPEAAVLAMRNHIQDIESALGGYYDQQADGE